MRKVSLSVFLVMVFVAAALVITGCSKGPSGEAGKGTIKIGYISSLSGPFAGVAQYCTPAVQMAIDNVNAAGGINGRKVELVVRDDTGDASVIAQKANELVGAGCVVVLGGLLDPCDKALSAWAKDAKVPTILTSLHFAGPAHDRFQQVQLLHRSALLCPCHPLCTNGI